jgi:hypothetical protein
MIDDPNRVTYSAHFPGAFPFGPGWSNHRRAHHPGESRKQENAMRIDVSAVDHLLTTTRGVRRRFEFVEGKTG